MFRPVNTSVISPSRRFLAFSACSISAQPASLCCRNAVRSGMNAAPTIRFLSSLRFGIKHFQRPYCCRPAGFNAELFEDFLHVFFHGGFGNAENSRDV